MTAQQLADRARELAAGINRCASGRHILGDGDAARGRCPFCEHVRRGGAR